MKSFYERDIRGLYIGLKVQATSVSAPGELTDQHPEILNEFFKTFSDILAAKYTRFPERKPAVKFEKRTKPLLPSAKAPEKKIVPEKKPL